ncbi:MAG: hypothetical protein AB7F50_11425 [Fimbriimonadaceae bacterium]
MNVLSLVLASATLPALGTNLAPLGPGGTSWPFWDVTRSSGSWTRSGAVWRMELFGEGTPHPPYGKFVATWEGDGTMSIEGGKLGVTLPGSLEFEPGEGKVELVFRGESAPQAKVTAPGYDPSWAGLYRPVFLQRARLYPVLRLDSWRSIKGDGVAIPDLVELLRETHSSPWLSVRAGTTVEETKVEIAQWAALLPTGATVILDVGAMETDFAAHFAAARVGLGSERTLVRVLRLDSASAAAAAEVAGRVSASDADALSVPMRFGRTTSASKPAEAAACLASLGNEVDALLAEAKEVRDSIRRNRWDLLCHDGGLELPNPAGATQEQKDMLDGVARDPAMNGLYLKLLRGWRQLDGSLFCHASDCAPLFVQNRAGALEWIEQDTMASPRRAALVEFALFPDR